MSNIHCPEKVLKILKENQIYFKEKVSATCKYGHKYGVHGEDSIFECPNCKKYSKKHIINMIRNRKNAKMKLGFNREREKLIPCSVYIIRMKKNINGVNEVFYKIGLSTNPINRFGKFPYETEIVKMIFTNKATAILIERCLHMVHDERNLSYAPNVGFEGCSECFSDILLDKIQLFIDDEQKYLKKYAIHLLNCY